MIALLLIPFFLQMIVINIDEFCFHVKRDLPKWERIGHPLDTLTVLVCFGFVFFMPYSPLNLKIYSGLALFSCLFVTKDEFVHKHCCPASEQWLHALLFINHPIVLAAAGLLWPIIHETILFSWMQDLLVHRQMIYNFFLVQIAASFLFFLYQIIYWNFLCPKKV